MSNKYDAVIIGAGMSGLMAARHLEKYNLDVLVLEESDRPGGRLKTDVVDGFRFDHGFQVLLTAYPEARRQLNYEKLNLKNFKPGGIFFNRDRKFEYSDSRGHKLAPVKNTFSPAGTMMDKIRLGNLKARCQAMEAEQIFELPEMSTMNFLRQRRFSEKMINRLFKPCFGSIFLENRLDTSSRIFRFLIKMLSEGYAAIPAKGIEEIPRQIKSSLGRSEFKFHTAVKKVSKGKIILENNDIIECDKIIIATNPDQMIPRLKTVQKWEGTANYYFSADESVLDKKMIAFNYEKKRIVNQFTVISDTSPDYAPKDKHLVSVSLNKIPRGSVEEVSDQIKRELSMSFGKSVATWEFLQNYHLPKALPKIPNAQFDVPFSETMIKEGVYLAGDHLLHGSLNGAMRSGELAAMAVVMDS